MNADTGSNIENAAAVVSKADALLITAGAGMGVDSGLPDFRGDKGFWKAYPPFERLGVSFIDMANPDWFARDPELAWGFYGHRLGLYRSTEPHRGFAILKRWAEGMEHGSFVFTSNVDGQFQSAGFDRERVIECHGSISHLQCSEPCSNRIWRADAVEVEVDENTFRAVSEIPECPDCGAVARPNVLMFGDWHWIPQRTGEQERRFSGWLARSAGPRLVIIELGAGSAVPTVRMTSERVASRTGASLVRINPREPQAPLGHVGIAADALEALEQIDAKLGDLID
jgi:NAD-dependent SIR2 family protein deacetylase